MEYPKSLREIYEELSLDKERLFDAEELTEALGDLWNDDARDWDAPPEARAKRAWARYLQQAPRCRWDDVPPGFGRDKLYMALRGKRRETAKLYLRRARHFNSKRAVVYLKLALGWDAELLGLILDKAPAGELILPFHMFTQPGRGNRVYVSGTLPIVAAAMDDLPALKLLAARGYRLDRTEAQPDGSVWNGRDMPRRGTREPVEFRVDQIWYRLLGRGTEELPLPPEKLSESTCLEHADALAAAMYCGARRCTRWLLFREDVPVSEAALRALARDETWLPPPTAERFRRFRAWAGLELLRQRGIRLAQALTPEQIPHNRPLILESLRCHPRPDPEWLKAQLGWYWDGVLEYPCEPGDPGWDFARACLERVDRDLAARVVAELLEGNGAIYQELQTLCQGLELPFPGSTQKHKEETP